ncbi:MAG: rhodanese-like domain-containing protein [Bacteroidota bacterium]
MKRQWLLLSLILGLSFTIQAQNDPLPASDVDYDEFMRLSQEVDEYRKSRLIDLQTFQQMAQEEGVLILDTRSKSAYKQKHIKGAVHLNFSDFTEKKLAKLIPSPNTKILIYCNNNFEQDPMHFARKSAPLALNIPTFINLYGYGYKNLFELADLIPVDDDRLEFEGKAVED